MDINESAEHKKRQKWPAYSDVAYLSHLESLVAAFAFAAFPPKQNRHERRERNSNL